MLAGVTLARQRVNEAKMTRRLVRGISVERALQ
jgi:hypothetical protein